MGANALVVADLISREVALEFLSSNSSPRGGSLAVINRIAVAPGRRWRRALERDFCGRAGWQRSERPLAANSTAPHGKNCASHFDRGAAVIGFLQMQTVRSCLLLEAERGGWDDRLQAEPRDGNRHDLVPGPFVSIANVQTEFQIVETSNRGHPSNSQNPCQHWFCGPDTRI